MNYKICCHTSEIEFELPSDAQVEIIRQPQIPLLPNPEEAVRRALSCPVGTPPLRELAKKYDSALILVTDYTRPLPYPQLLSPLLEELRAGGIAEEQIRFLVASGTHRPMTAQELDAHLGAEVVRRYQVLPHLWWQEEHLADLGTTQSGTPIRINRLLTGEQLLIGVGVVKPHRDAGWSGGAKIIQPGVCGNVTTGATHWLAAQHPCHDILGQEENPVRAEMEEIAARVDLDFILNCVTDDEHRLAHVSTGHFVLAHRAEVEFAREHFTVPFGWEADLFIAGSSPVQQGMWSLGSGPNWAQAMLRKGGRMLHAGRCQQGICPEHPQVEELGYRSLENLRRLMESGRLTDLAAASHLHHGGEKMYDKEVQVHFHCPDLSTRQIETLGFRDARNFQQALDGILDELGPAPKVYIYPGYDFATLIPRYRNSVG